MKHVSVPHTARGRHILVVGGQADSLTILRGNLLQAMVARGYRVSTAASGGPAHVREQLKAWGADFHEIPMERAGLNPLKDFSTIASLAKLMRKLRPDIVLGYQAKPLNYAMLAGALAGVPRRVGLVTGLGYAFTEGGERRRRLTGMVVRAVYRLGLRFAHGAIFQNEDDRRLFELRQLLRPATRTIRVHGSGVDLQRYVPTREPVGPVRFVMIARLLRDKGVYEFVEAARRVRLGLPNAQFTLVGPFDPNPAAVKPGEVAAWVHEGIVQHAGAVDDVRPWIEGAHVAVLPSYREGVPRTLLEAMAMGRPIVTTDVPGCRDAVVHGENGLLVPPRDPAALAAAMMELGRSGALRGELGGCGRQRAVRLFDAAAVSDEVLSFVEQLQ